VGAVKAPTIRRSQLARAVEPGMMFAFNIDLHIIRNIDKKVTKYPGCLTQESEAISKAFWLPRRSVPLPDRR
jgi:hypothetical protein